MMAGLHLFLYLQDDGVPDGELLLSHENKSPIGDKYQFQRITGGITRWGGCNSPCDIYIQLCLCLCISQIDLPEHL